MLARFTRNFMFARANFVQSKPIRPAGEVDDTFNHYNSPTNSMGKFIYG